MKTQTVLPLQTVKTRAPLRRVSNGNKNYEDKIRDYYFFIISAISLYSPICILLPPLSVSQDE